MSETTPKHWHIWTVDGDHSQREPKRFYHRQAAHRAVKDRGLQGKARIHECTEGEDCPTPAC